MAPLIVLVKFTNKGAMQEVVLSAEKEIIGLGRIVIDFEIESTQPPKLAIIFIIKLPGVL